MPSFQQVIVIGHLGQDPEIKYMPSGKAVCNISVATTEKWKDKDTGQNKEDTEWHRITLFEHVAKVCGKYLRKGSAAMFIGKLKTRKWQDKSGNNRYATEIIAREMKLLGGKESSSTVQSTTTVLQPDPEAEFDDDISF